MSLSSKRSKLETTWSDIINSLGINEELKSSVIGTMVQSGSTLDYTKYNEHLQLLLCRDAGIEGWEHKVLETILEANEGLPSPSSMKFSYVAKLLEGNISADTSGLNEVYRKNPSLSNEEETTIGSFYSLANKSFSLSSEGDSCVRVITLLLALIKFNSCLECSSQPSIKDHANFLIQVTNNQTTKLCIIEVKNPSIKCSLNLQTDEVAQALREAYLVLSSNPDLESLLLVLTNAMDWSFALVEKGAHQKIKVTSMWHEDTTLKQQPHSVYLMIRNYLLL